MDRIKTNRRITSYLYKWERQLLDHFRRLLNSSSEGEFYVLVQFAKSRILIHEVGEKQRVVGQIEETQPQKLDKQ